MSHSLLLTTKRALALACGQPVFPSEVGVPFLHLCTNQMTVFLSQVNFSFWSVGRGRSGWELRGYAQGHLLWGAVLTGVVTTVGIGTAGGRKARPVLLATQPGAPVSQASQAPSFLVRHEGGEFRGVPGLADGGGMPGHPAGVWVAQFAALGCTVSGHCHIREGADICGRERASWW